MGNLIVFGPFFVSLPSIWINRSLWLKGINIEQTRHIKLQHPQAISSSMCVYMFAGAHENTVLLDCGRVSPFSLLLFNSREQEMFTENLKFVLWLMLEERPCVYKNPRIYPLGSINVFRKFHYNIHFLWHIDCTSWNFSLPVSKLERVCLPGSMTLVREFPD